MTRTLHRLTARKVDATIKAGITGRHADGGNLYLLISDGPHSGARWTFMFSRAGKQTELGLGPARDVTLAEARDKAAEMRRARLRGDDLLAHRKRKIAEARKPTFGVFAKAWADEQAKGLKDAKSQQQMRTGFDTYCKPILDRRIDQVTTEDVLQVLKPKWHETRETMRRLRAKIEKALDAAKAQGLRDGPNPAAWKGHLAAHCRTARPAPSRNTIGPRPTPTCRRSSPSCAPPTAPRRGR
jgi:hypothetical protein